MSIINLLSLSQSPPTLLLLSLLMPVAQTINNLMRTHGWNLGPSDYKKAKNKTKTLCSQGKLRCMIVWYLNQVEPIILAPEGFLRVHQFGQRKNNWLNDTRRPVWTKKENTSMSQYIRSFKDWYNKPLLVWKSPYLLTSEVDTRLLEIWELDATWIRYLEMEDTKYVSPTTFHGISRGWLQNQNRWLTSVPSGSVWFLLF